MNRLGSFFKLLKLFWDQGDRLIELFELLLKQLPLVGQALEDAGNVAVQTSQIIQGGNGCPPGAAELVKTAATAIGRCHDQLGKIPNDIRHIQVTLQNLSLPAVSISNQSYSLPGGIGSVTIPTASVSSANPLGPIEALLQEPQTLIQAASNELDTAKQELDLLSGDITNAGNDVLQIGRSLQEAGKLFKAIGAGG